MHLVMLCTVLFLSVLLAAQSSVLVAGQNLYVVSSIEATKDRLTTQPPIPFGNAGSGPTIQFQPRLRYQRIHGFGGAMTEAAAVNMMGLPQNLQDQIMRDYYDPQVGNVYTVTRVPINSCDFTVASYNFDNVTDDFALKYFDTNVTHDTTTIIPYIKQAMKTSNNRVQLFGTPWSPPGWMKGNGQMDGSSMPCLKADPRYHQAWADYFVQWLNAYKGHGINFWGLTAQNEPENAGVWECCYYNATDERNFVRDFLGPTVHKSYPEMKLMIHDHNKDHVNLYANAVYADASASEHVWGTAIHWYSGSEFENVQLLHANWPEKHILATEACNCQGVHFDDWGRGESYAIDVTGDLNSWAEGWTDWNLVLNQQGGPNHLGNFCDAPIIARYDTNPYSLHYQPNYYIFGQFTRFLPPGAQRINYTSDATSLLITAFIVTLDANDVTHSQLRVLVGASKGDYIVLVATNVNNDATVLQVQAGKQFATLQVPAHSIHTLAFDASLVGNNEEILIQ